VGEGWEVKILRRERGEGDVDFESLEGSEWSKGDVGGRREINRHRC